MKKNITMIAMIAIALGAVSCGKKEETVTEKVKDALNVRPNEEVKDAVEDLEKDAKDVGRDISDAVKDAADKVTK